jgi:hypothetical protein
MTKQEIFENSIGCNDLTTFKSLLNDPDVNVSYDNNFLIRFSSQNGHTEIVKILIKDSRVDPSDENNWAIRYANIYEYTEMCFFLFKDKRVKDKLRLENKELYNELSKKIIKYKIEDF